MAEKRNIFFHVGLAKTGSTYLQNRFFKHLAGIQYQHTRQFKNADQFIATHPDEHVLVSREFDRQFYVEVDKFALKHPTATPIMLLRKQDKWMASQYRRFVKNGLADRLEAFLDLTNDNGYFKKIDLSFFHKIEYLESKFDNPPIVLLFDEFKKNPKQFLETLASRMDSSFNLKEINLEAKHAARTDKALKIIRSVNRIIPIRKTEVKWLGPFDIPRQWFMKLIKWKIILFSKICPAAWVSKEPLMDPTFLDAVAKEFEDDWNKCLAYSNREVV
jgi:hypothetical protein